MIDSDFVKKIMKEHRTVVISGGVFGAGIALESFNPGSITSLFFSPIAWVMGKIPDAGLGKTIGMLSSVLLYSSVSIVIAKVSNRK